MPSLTFSAAPAQEIEPPDPIPPWQSNEWHRWEEKLRFRFIEQKRGERLSPWRVHILHPDDHLLLEAFRIVWNGELPDCTDGPRTWKWELSRVWHVLELPPHLDAKQVRAMVLEQLGRRTNSGGD